MDIKNLSERIRPAMIKSGLTERVEKLKGISAPSTEVQNDVASAGGRLANSVIGSIATPTTNTESAVGKLGQQSKSVLSQVMDEEKDKKPMGMKKGGMVKSSASKRADGCAIRGKTRA